MIVLGFDTSTHATAVALLGSDGRTTELRDDPVTGAHPGHATRLLDLAAELLASAGVAWSGVDRIAVGVGPGTFTGLRVGVATARGLAQSLSIELAAVSSTLALAAGARADAGVRAQSTLAPDALLAVIDARRGEVFAAAYELAEHGLPRELAAPRALPPTALASVLVEAAGASDGGSRRWLAVGDGVLRFRAEVQAAGLHTAPDSSPVHRVSAATICELGAYGPAASLQEVVPDYRRRPDAELALKVAGIGRDN